MAESDRDTGKRRPDDGGFGDLQTRLDTLGKRLGTARGRSPKDDGDAAERRGSAMGVAFRIATELIAGVVVGGFIGWQLDKWLNTTPFMLLIFFVLGAGAGILNVMRTAQKMQADSGRD